MKRILAVGIDLEGEGVRKTPFFGRTAIHDADIVIVNPGVLGQTMWLDHREYNGEKYIYSTRGSDVLLADMANLQREFRAFLVQGGIVVVFASTLLDFQAEVKGGEFSRVSNYSWLPNEVSFFLSHFRNGSGDKILVCGNNEVGKRYMGAFGNSLVYETYLEVYGLQLGRIDMSLPASCSLELFLLNNASFPVGWAIGCGKGLFVFLPLPQKPVQRRLVGVLLECVDLLRGGTEETAPPSWIEHYVVPGEPELKSKIDAIDGDIAARNKERLAMLNSLAALTDFKGLLFEKGKILEDIVIDAMRLLGFKAERYGEGDMEHDLILECEEGRIIGEIEGKDKEPIKIEKLDQLSRVVDEDFHRNEILADGLLIGNPYRLQLVEERKAAFSNKVIVAAGRKRFGLLSTVELYRAVIEVLKNPSEELKRALRERIFHGLGGIISFENKLNVLGSTIGDRKAGK